MNHTNQELVHYTLTITMIAELLKTGKLAGGIGALHGLIVLVGSSAGFAEIIPEDELVAAVREAYRDAQAAAMGDDGPNPLVRGFKRLKTSLVAAANATPAPIDAIEITAGFEKAGE